MAFEKFYTTHIDTRKIGPFGLRRESIAQHTIPVPKHTVAIRITTTDLEPVVATIPDSKGEEIFYTQRPENPDLAPERHRFTRILTRNREKVAKLILPPTRRERIIVGLLGIAALAVAGAALYTNQEEQLDYQGLSRGVTYPIPQSCLPAIVIGNNFDASDTSGNSRSFAVQPDIYAVIPVNHITSITPHSPMLALCDQTNPDQVAATFQQDYSTQLNGKKVEVTNPLP